MMKTRDSGNAVSNKVQSAAAGATIPRDMMMMLKNYNKRV
jgi:hypothetical protein